MTKTWTTILAVAVASVTCMVNAQTVKGDAKAGESKVDMCIGCHGIPGYQASFPQVYKVPMIGGQNEAYIVAALQAYKKGERKHPSMPVMASSRKPAKPRSLRQQSQPCCKKALASLVTAKAFPNRLTLHIPNWLVSTQTICMSRSSPIKTVPTTGS